MPVSPNTLLTLSIPTLSLISILLHSLKSGEDLPTTDWFRPLGERAMFPPSFGATHEHTLGKLPSVSSGAPENLATSG